MKIWIDAQLSPAIAQWICRRFDGIEAVAVRDLGFRDSEDLEIFEAARKANAAVMSKDSDFVELVSRLGSPPRVLWIRCGNTSNAHLQSTLKNTLVVAVGLLEKGESLVEIVG